VTGEAAPERLGFFVHCLDQKGRIAFMLNEPLMLRPGLGFAPEGRRCTTFHLLRSRPDTPDGTYRVAVGLLNPGLPLRRIEPVSTLAIDANRLLLPRAVTLQRTP
jgi:hypothetical protein